MRKATSLWLAFLFASVVGEASASQLVFGLDHNVAGSRAPMAAPQGLQFMLEFHPPNDPGVLQRLGGGVYWGRSTAAA